MKQKSCVRGYEYYTNILTIDSYLAASFKRRQLSIQWQNDYSEAKYFNLKNVCEKKNDNTYSSNWPIRVIV